MALLSEAAASTPDPLIDTCPPTLLETYAAADNGEGRQGTRILWCIPKIYFTWWQRSSKTLHSIFTRVWEDEVVPEEWHQGIIIPLYKGKGSRSDCSNYIGIALLSVPGKLFAKVILSRIRPTLLAHRRPQQSGFTPGRSTCDRIVTLNNIAQRRQDYGHSTYAAYVDLHAAFDSLSSLWLLLTRLGIPDKIVNLFRAL